MIGKEYKHLSRKDLLEMLIEQDAEIEQLQFDLQDAKKRLKSRDINIKEAGTIAEASFALNGVLEATDAAAQQYLENIKKCSENQEAEKEKILADARQQADDILAQAQAQKELLMQEADDYWNQLSGKLESFYEEHHGLRELVSGLSKKGCQ